MDTEKLRNLTDAELEHQQRELNDQLFRMKFQLKMGQTESLNKIRGLRKDVARIKTIMREKELGLSNGTKSAATVPAEDTEKAATPAAAKPARARKSSAAARKSAGARKATATAKKKKTAGAKAKAKARKK
jgi:large subunit ribosomal protein L29